MAGHAWPTSQCLTTTTGRPLHARLGRLAERVDSPTHVLAPIAFSSAPSQAWYLLEQTRSTPRSCGSAPLAR